MNVLSVAASDASVEAKAGSKSEAKSKVESKPKAPAKAKAPAKTKAPAKAKSESKPNADVVVQVESNVEVKVEAKSKAKPRARKSTTTATTTIEKELHESELTKSTEDPSTKKDIDTDVIDPTSLMKAVMKESYMKHPMEVEEVHAQEESHHDGVLSHLGEYIDEPFTLIESYFRGKHLERLVRHQIESYNHFIQYQAQRTIQMFNSVTIRSENDYIEQYDKYLLEITINFQNFKLHPPQIHENNGATKLMFPQEAKLRNFTYASPMTIDMHIDYTIRNTEQMDNPRVISKVLSKINIGKMPIMLKSDICLLNQNRAMDPAAIGECGMDCGGYFIIKGSEKTVLGQERAAENRVYCYYGKNMTKWNWYAEIKSIPDFKCISPKQIDMMISSRNNGVGHPIYVQIPRIRQPMELFAVFRALGVVSDRDICQYILQDVDDPANEELLAALQASVLDANKYTTTEAALKHVTTYAAYTPVLHFDRERNAKRKQEFVTEVLNNDLFPHCRTHVQRLYMLGYMCRKLIQTSLGWLQPNDRDSYLNKRIELTGTLINNLFRNYFNKMVKEMQKQVVREINNGSWRSTDNYEAILNMTNIYKMIKSTTIENGINRALSTGDFSIKESNSSKVGVAQVLSRLTYLSGLSHLRRINTPLEKSGELIAPRKLHNTTYGFLCLSGDTEVLMANRVDTKKIRDIRDGEWVNTINRTTLQDEPSPIHSWFCKMPDKLYEITTVSGRTIKATADHPFLVNVGGGKYEMIKLGELKTGDKMVVRHMVRDLPSQQPVDITHKPAARLMGGSHRFNSNTFYVNETSDVHQVTQDLEKLGYCDMTTTCLCTNPARWKIQCNEYHDMFSLSWLSSADLSVQREFLSTFQANRGSSLEFRNEQPYLPPTYYHLNKDESVSTVMESMETVVSMLSGLGIRAQYTANDDGTVVCIVFDQSSENLLQYADTIHYAYCDKKRRDSAPVIEYLKIYAQCPRIDIQELKGRSETIMEDPSTYSEAKLRIMKYYARDNTCASGCTSVPILHIKEVEPEMVYDFTTYSENHSFVAASLVTSNCSVESPEGQSIGVVKNISYMTHITIPTHSNSLYEYITPLIRTLEECTPEQLHGKVRVLINGVWIGVTDTPQELYRDLKDKKYQGIIQIYTSIVFDYRNMEIRVCNDGGRMVRPVLKVRNNRALLTHDVLDRLEQRELEWNDLVVSCRLPESIMEYIDPEEQNYAMIAMKSKGSYLHPPESMIQYTHCEIHPSTMFGILASCIPFPEHNQSPRNTYQCLHPDEEVYTANGRGLVPIRDIVVGDEVYTFDPETMNVVVARVSGQFVQPNAHDTLIRLRTTTGRKLVVTPDHRVMTDEGWVTAEDLAAMTEPNIRMGIWMRKYTQDEVRDQVFGCTVMLNRVRNFMQQYRSHNTALAVFCMSNEFFLIVEFLRTFQVEDHDRIWTEYFQHNPEQCVIEYTYWSKHVVEIRGDFLMVPLANCEVWHRPGFTPVPTLSLRNPDDSSMIHKSPTSWSTHVSCLEVDHPNHSFITASRYGSANCCMGKQAIGVYALNFDQRMDKTAYVLAYPSRPLVDTRLMNCIHLNQIPSGHQVIVAIASLTSYNQEDSILMNQGAIDRGLFATTIYHTEKDEDKNIIRDEIVRCKPDPKKTRGIKYGDYSKLNAQGFIPENTFVENRDVIIAKIVPIKENRNDPTKTIKYEDQSKTYRTTEESYIDKNYTGRNGDGYNFAKVRVRTFRTPVIGDKFASRSAQKGTCGLIIPEADMPFTKDGVRPDIILNPHAIPSRMTIAQLKETLLGKVLIQLGMFGDATSFGNNLNIDAILRELQRVGYESYGNEVMYDGMSGQQLEANIFIGPVFYQRLKHMVNDKQHSRSIGPMVNLTRQPAEGRSRDGGFRIGEMERDVMVAHGMSRFCRERLYDVSDKYSTHVCNRCGLIAAYNDPSTHQSSAGRNAKNTSISDMVVHHCRTCDNTTDFSLVEIPYAYKLLAQELQTMNIVPRILTE